MVRFLATMLVHLLLPTSVVALTVEAVSTYETSDNFYEITRRNIPEQSTPSDLPAVLPPTIHFPLPLLRRPAVIIK